MILKKYKYVAFTFMIFFMGYSNGYAELPYSSFAPLVKKVLPAVVNIRTEIEIEERVPQLPPELEGFPFLFGERGNNEIEKRKGASLGSGFIIDAARGYIITNHHVIDKANKIVVMFQDGKKVDAEIKGDDAKTDLALLKIDPKGLKLNEVKFATEVPEVGDLVLAAGNPFGLGGTVTTGIVSAQNRDIHAGSYDNFLQTDASINPGSSGGPLFNMKGEVVGVNSVILSPSDGSSSVGGNVGIGFAISAQLAKQIVNELISDGKITRGWLGVLISPVSDEQAEALGLEQSKGAFVQEVTEGSPSIKAGIKAGDIILKFDGKDVTSVRTLPLMVADTKIGKNVEVEVWRDGKIKKFNVKIAELKDTQKKPSSSYKVKGNDANYISSKLGLGLIELNSSIRQKYNIKSSIKGLLVLTVDYNSNAKEKGIREGMVISEINNVPVSTIAEFKKQLVQAIKLKRKAVMFTIRFEDVTRFVGVFIKDKK